MVENMFLQEGSSIGYACSAIGTRIAQANINMTLMDVSTSDRTVFVRRPRQWNQLAQVGFVS